MSDLIEALQQDAPARELAPLALPKRFRAAVVEESDATIFQAGADNDVRASIKIIDVPMPALAPDEVVVGVMASAINFNTVWTALFEPVPTFKFLKHLGKSGPLGSRHDRPFHVLGSDGAGVVVKVGSSVRRWKVGDEVVIHTAYIDPEDPISQQDGMLTADLRAWGYETNYGGLADFTIVKATQLMPKAAHLSWEEAACIPLCGATAYRMLISDQGARMKQGDIVLIWGATGGLGGFAVQLVARGGGIPVGVVSSADKAELARRLGCAAVIDRSELGVSDMLDPGNWRLLRREIRNLVGEDPHIVFDYVGQQTFGASVYLARRGGKVVTCGSSTGYRHEYDNRYLWMNLKSIVGSHGANYQEAWEANRLVALGMLQPTLSEVHPLEETAAATRRVQLNQHVGKVGILCLAAEEGLGIRDQARRDSLGEQKFRTLRRA